MDLLEVRFREALARRGVPAAGASALLKRIRSTALEAAYGQIADGAAQLRVTTLLVAVERVGDKLRGAL